MIKGPVNSGGHFESVSYLSRRLPEAVQQYLMPILSPLSNNMIFLNQKKEKHIHNTMCKTYGSISGLLANKAATIVPGKLQKNPMVILTKGNVINLVYILEGTMMPKET